MARKPKKGELEKNLPDPQENLKAEEQKKQEEKIKDQGKINPQDEEVQAQEEPKLDEPVEPVKPEEVQDKLLEPSPAPKPAQAESEVIPFEPVGEIAESPETSEAVQSYNQASQRERVARHKMAQQQLKQAMFQKNLPKVFEKRRTQLKAALASAEDRLMSAPPVRASLINTGSLGEVVLAAVFNVASGGSYLKGLKESYARARQERNDAISEYQKVSELYKDNELGEMQFTKDMLSNIQTMLQIEAQTDPINREIKMQQVEKIKIETKNIQDTMDKRKDQKVTTDLNNSLKREQLKQMREEAPLNQEYKQALVDKTKAEALVSRRKASDTISHVLQKQREFVPGVKALASNDPKELTKARVKVGTYKRVLPVVDEVLKRAKTFEKQDWTSILKRTKTLKSSLLERVGKASKKDIANLKELKRFNTDLHSFFGGVKDMLQLGRLSDWDALFIKDYLNLVDSKKVASSLSYLTPSNLDKLQRAVVRLSKSMREDAYNLTLPVDTETEESLDQDQFEERIRESIGISSKNKSASRSESPPVKTVSGEPSGPISYDSLDSLYKGEFAKGNK